VFFATAFLTFMQNFTRLKCALDPSVLRWDRWCIPPLPAPLHPSSCISSAPRDSIELEHTSRHNAQHDKTGQIIQSIYMGNHFPTQTTLNFFAGSQSPTTTFLKLFPILVSSVAISTPQVDESVIVIRIHDTYPNPPNVS
jgi:hypothetical protein